MTSKKTFHRSWRNPCPAAFDVLCSGSRRPELNSNENNALVSVCLVLQRKISPKLPRASVFEITAFAPINSCGETLILLQFKRARHQPKHNARSRVRACYLLSRFSLGTPWNSMSMPLTSNSKENTVSKAC